ncbi:DUF1254 domain-containing protein [Leisingera sp.]|uniref:DUF1254 domain-containing protein n=1 Tax=Leisingera sp. TaxID=1879318 RepID=UPI002B270EB6|nr:DUF1254 domain-containing protein [Leisingera sp.]
MLKSLQRTIFACGGAAIMLASSGAKAEDVTAEEARAIAKDAYIYGYPLVENYRIQHAYFADEGGSQYKGPWNTVVNVARLYTPQDTAVQTPNSDTPYSFVGADLRAEPIVLTVPGMEEDRYYSLQFIDAYTFNFHYTGSRTTGNDGGTYLLAGPRWQGEYPEGIDEVVHSETDFAFIIYRTQLFNEADLDNVKKIQSGYKVQTLSEYSGVPAPSGEGIAELTAPASKPDSVGHEPLPPKAIKPLTQGEERTSLEFFGILDLVLNFAPVPPEEKDLRARFAKIGIGEGFDPEALPAEVKAAIRKGMADAWQAYDEFKATKIDASEVTSADILGSREHINGRWIYRMAGTVIGIYGNSVEEAFYPLITVDSNGEPFDGANRYEVTFSEGETPPVNAFWSMTMYDLPQSLLVENPINRYLINSPMVPDMTRNPDGSLTIYIQHDKPSAGKVSNWLPAPKGPFWVPMRLYWPKESALNGSWTVPPVEQAN